MAQYVEYADLVYVEYTDGVDTFRDGSRDTAYVIDKELTVTGFDGVEDLDWEEIESHTHPSATGVFRDGVRSGNYVIDAEINVTGFDGSLNIDWVNLQTHT